ncbi:hypothetical protein AY599_03715 [Leptolyngbya valderiana BDU 20041]|nr:ATP-binding protein [Geitlerinema sp. CS-897]OAB62380.1 hypothetical protein AY599_03715 [Leptolyngbya valderiana BDU 20041]
MIPPQLCHLLVGIPGSGKTTFARQWIERDPRYRLISTDAIRQRLYDDAAIQGDWNDIEVEVLRQLRQASRDDRPVIYDATNVKPQWRLGFLQNLHSLDPPPPWNWMAWVFAVSPATCKQRNANRRRVVPNEIIDEMAEAIDRFPPTPDEGFVAVSEVPLTDDGNFDFSAVFEIVEKCDRSSCQK